jgi:hypothetical protein
MGGTNEVKNLILLTAKEHFVAHLLLVKMTEGVNRQKLVFAFIKMNSKNSFQQRTHARSYQFFKLAYAHHLKGLNKGKPKSPEMRHKLSMTNTGHIVTPETRKKISLSNKGRPAHPNTVAAAKLKGKKHSPETKMKMAVAALGHTLSMDSRNKISRANKGKLLGSNHPGYGKIWYNDGAINVRIDPHDVVPKGFKRGLLKCCSH